MANSGSGNPIITAALAKMALLRQAPDVDRVTLDLFAAELESSGITPDVVVIACQALQTRPRADGETAFPSFGTLLEACYGIRREWQKQAEAVASQRLLEAERAGQRNMTKAEAAAFIAQLKADVDRRVRELRDEKAPR